MSNTGDDACTQQVPRKRNQSVAQVEPHQYSQRLIPAAGAVRPGPSPMPAKIVDNRCFHRKGGSPQIVNAEYADQRKEHDKLNGRAGCAYSSEFDSASERDAIPGGRVTR